jgi:hypothetical protein
MAKKCIPGLICVENMTLFILVILTISVGYLYWKQFSKERTTILPTSPQVHYPLLARDRSGIAQIVQTPIVDTASIGLQNIYSPPLNTIDVRGPVELPPLPVGLPVNIRTSTANTPYRQIGILTKNVRTGNGATDPLILPLFGRNLLNGRDKWQYYTVANSGGATFNAKLPISVNGRSCTSEYGCDSVSNGDVVYVEGYDDTFRATIYENATLSYIPY